jgi:hypothetical protein
MTRNRCNLHLSDLLDEQSLPDSANIFFELFLEDGKGNFIDVPILNKNYFDKDGNQPNKGNIMNDKWVLSRRFMMFDTISGMKEVNSYLSETGTPEYIRWADSINIKVEMNLASPEQIFRPYVSIEYKEI